MVLTKAEELFEAFCRDKTIAWSRIPESGQAVPDYEIRLTDRAIAVEVKQLEPNESEREILEELGTRGRTAHWVNMGRARNPLFAAGKQLRSYAKGRMPGVVVLYNAIGGAFSYLDAYNIAHCLYGGEKAHFAVAPDPKDDIDYLGMSRGGRSVATAEENTTISAVAVLSQEWQSPPQLVLYHNLHAVLPLRSSEAAQYGIPQFRFAPPGPGLMPVWLPYDGDDEQLPN